MMLRFYNFVVFIKFSILREEVISLSGQMFLISVRSLGDASDGTHCWSGRNIVVRTGLVIFFHNKWIFWVFKTGVCDGLIVLEIDLDTKVASLRICKCGLFAGYIVLSLSMLWEGNNLYLMKNHRLTIFRFQHFLIF